ncbi:TPA: sulfatase [Salmonella enterica subsp. enterica serovar Infantis]|nr:sulfatase [Salmonella enterica subsp. enterica serovar Infantis]HCD0612671.1 sulfatase [Salmonella enterica subsp. enterica serovar Infantis]
MRKIIIAQAIGIAFCIPTMLMAKDFSPQINSDRPNIILIVAEDMNPRLGVYGDKNARTPNLDALAKESVLFTQAFTMAGVSAPSRAGLITGMLPNNTGLQHMRTLSRPDGPYIGVPPAYVKGYPELLRRAGYFTYNDTKTDYQFSKGPADVGPFTLWTQHGEYNNSDDMHIPVAWRNFDLQGKPFFMNFNPQITHESALFSPENCPKGWEEMVKRWQEFRSHYKYTPTDASKIDVGPWLRDTPRTRQELAQHYDNIHIMDMQVGKLIDSLKADGLWDNTIVIFTADNGDGIPHHKRELYDSGTHVPLIIHIPPKYRPADWPAAGSKDDRLISFEDFAPTLLSFAGQNVPFYMQGINLAQDNAPKREFVYGVRGRMDNVDMRSYTVRNDKYQYIRNMTSTPNGASIRFRNALGSMKDLNLALKENKLTATQQQWFEPAVPEELYDLVADPLQTRNLAGDDRMKAVLSTFRQALDERRNQNNDMNLIEESQMVSDLQDAAGQQQQTLPPVATLDKINGKIYLASRTQGASVGYSWDGKTWEVYTGSITPRADQHQLLAKAVRYGWKESEVSTLVLRP